MKTRKRNDLRTGIPPTQRYAAARTSANHETESLTHPLPEGEGDPLRRHVDAEHVAVAGREVPRPAVAHLAVVVEPAARALDHDVAGERVVGAGRAGANHHDRPRR